MTWSKQQAEDAINEFFDEYTDSDYNLQLPDQDYKIYELFCLSKLLQWVKKRYDVKIHLSNHNNKARGQKISFKSGVGPINRKKYTYFTISNGTIDLLEVHTDVQVLVKGLSAPIGNVDSRTANEIDIVVVRANVRDGSPVNPSDLVLGIECKLRESGEIESRTIKEIIGVRNEISHRTQSKNYSDIDKILSASSPKRPRTVLMIPHSEYWFAQIGKNVKKYKQRLKQAEIVLRVWRP